MLSTFQMRDGEFGPFQYRIMEYDKPTQSLIPVDLTNKSITFMLYEREQQTNGTYLESIFASGSCEILDAEDGWVQATFPTISTGWYRVEFPMESATMKRVYPRFGDQLIEVT